MLRPPLSSSLSSAGPSRLSNNVQSSVGVEPPASWNATRSEEPTTPTTTSPRKSRNDIFSLDWSLPATPNVASRASTPVNSPSPRPNWRTQQRERELSSEDDLGPVKPGVISSSSPLTAPVARRLSYGTDEKDFDKGLQISVNHHDQSQVPDMHDLDPTEQDRRRHQGAGPLGVTAGISDNPVLDSRQSPRVRLIPNSDYLLGEGRHASVYVSSFLPRDVTSPSKAWKLCAAKRISPDRESQLAGLGEAFILSKLNAPPQPSTSRSFAARGSQFIIDLYGVRDERDGIESMGSVGSEDQTARRRKAWNEASSAASLGLGRPLGPTASHTDLRAASELISASNLPHRRSLRRKKSFEPSNLSPPIGSPSVDQHGVEYFPLPRQAALLDRDRKGPRHSAPGGLAPPSVVTSPPHDSRAGAASRVPSGTSTVSDSTARSPRPTSPRIILLLEYAPYGHALAFAQAYPERMGKKRWLSWARELVAAVAWAHERGVLHSDIKPQNVLVSSDSGQDKPMSDPIPTRQVASDLSVRLADFGMSMFLPPPDSALPAPSDPMGLGTPAYSPPEFVRPPPSPFGRPSDVFSLGVTLSVLISGHEPYENMRSVERMLWVGRGAYWDWETRRREGGFESASVSRAGSIRSGRTRSRAGSGASSISALAGVSLSATSASASGRRSGSVDSERSVRSFASASGRAGPRTLAHNAARLLVQEEGPDRADIDTVQEKEITAIVPVNAVPPPSPPLGADDDYQDSAIGTDDEQHEAVGEGGAITSPIAGETYSDGTPAVYFLNGFDVVPLQVLHLLQAMTHPKPTSRPTVEAVLNVLDEM